MLPGAKICSREQLCRALLQRTVSHTIIRATKADPPVYCLLSNTTANTPTTVASPTPLLMRQTDATMVATAATTFFLFREGLCRSGGIVDR
jgi:hypothetical protein